jgi:hypothetical protein
MLTGIWHGAEWTFVIWGALHGLYQIVGILTRPSRDRLLKKMGIEVSSAPVVWIRRVVTFILVSFAWIFFRANSFSDAITLVSGLTDFSMGLKETLALMGLDLTGALMTVLSIVSLLIIEKLLHYEESPDGSEALIKNGAFTYVIWIIAFAWMLLLSKDMVSTFIYFQF